MKIGTRISEFFERGEPLLSVEFFPAKTEEGARQILRTAKELQALSPDFVSITYGAGGSTRERTLAYGELLRDLFDFEVMPHLTCVGHGRDDLRALLKDWREKGFRNIMALRGDPPKGQKDFEPHPDGFHYGSELIAFIKSEFPEFCLGGGGYPEKHPEASTLEEDMANVKKKVDAGADFITTQLFFRNEDYFTYVKTARSLGIDVPIVPGVLPALDHDQVVKFTGFCGSYLPEELKRRMAEVKGNEDASREVGIAWAYDQIVELIEQGAPGVHLYILNRSRSTLELIRRLQTAGYFTHLPKVEAIG